MSTVQILEGDKSWSFEADGRQSLLDDALAQGVPVSYSCKRGDCGQCVAAVLAGHVRAIDGSRPLECDGKILLCNAATHGDLIIEIEHLPELDAIPVVRAPCKIQELVRLSDDVLEVSLRLPAATPFAFRAGQYIRLTNQERTTRSYSLANAPHADKLLHIHARRVAGGAFSRYLFGVAKPGDLLHLEGPIGRFIVRREARARKTVFAATGTGIAPIHAILSSLKPDERERFGDICIYWGNRGIDDAYFKVQMRDLSQRMEAEYFEVYSSPTPGDAINPVYAALGDPAPRRHVQDLVRAHHSDLIGAQVYASGNPGMIEDMRRQSLLLGLNLEHFHSDAFTRS